MHCTLENGSITYLQPLCNFLELGVGIQQLQGLLEVDVHPWSAPACHRGLHTAVQGTDTPRGQHKDNMIAPIEAMQAG